LSMLGRTHLKTAFEFVIKVMDREGGHFDLSPLRNYTAPHKPEATHCM
jgi:hypothetical protein